MYKANYLQYRQIYCTAKCPLDIKLNLRVELIFPRDEAKSGGGLHVSSRANKCLWVFLLPQDQELVCRRGSMAAEGRLPVSIGSFKMLLPKPAFVPAVSPIITSFCSFGTLCHGYLLPPLIKLCIM